ncbi:MAG: class I SAM-dependent methyltransferase [Anaerolineales bacterium]
MQAYGPRFAYIYNLRWNGFARAAAPHLLAYYAGTPLGHLRAPVLDVCCGSGLLAGVFLEQGFPVTGLDLSAHMLAYARSNTAAFTASGQAAYFQADAGQFALAPRFGLALSTYDALNHLPDQNALRGCLRATAAALRPGGTFVFDLNTRRGLQRWNGTLVDDHEDALVITRGAYDGSGDRAILNVTGFVPTAAGAYERFDETVYNTVFDIQAVLWWAEAEGFATAHAARLDNLGQPLAEPEAESRVFIVAQRG